MVNLSNRASTPNLNDIEINIFGTGYGEAIAIHLPGGIWILVDSCCDPKSELKKPVALEYLELLGVDKGKVKAIVATHWHADHTKGLTELATVFSDSLVFYPNFMREIEGLQLLMSYSGKGGTQENQASEITNLFTIAPQRMIPCGMFTAILQPTMLDGQILSVDAMSPMPNAFKKNMASVHQSLSEREGNVRKIANPGPNAASIAISINIGEESIILGSDLEEHHSYGWSALSVISRWNQRAKASFYKVAHHGSENAHADLKWENLLANKPISALTPFKHGSTSLPKQSDIDRLKSRGAILYTASGGSSAPSMPATHLKLLKQVAKQVVRKERAIGHLRFRKTLNSEEWVTECFGAAQAL